MIGPYTYEPVRLLPYDAAAAQVAVKVAEAISQSDPRLVVEHIGSTAIPACAGKGVVDVAVLYPAGDLDWAVAVLDGLGFQRQPGLDPFPESRPMRVGSLYRDGRPYRIHAHVLAAGCAEHLELIAFRETLRFRADLCRAYEAHKRAILAGGVTDSSAYARAKGVFVRGVLDRGRA